MPAAGAGPAVGVAPGEVLRDEQERLVLKADDVERLGGREGQEAGLAQFRFEREPLGFGEPRQGREPPVGEGLGLRQ